MADYIPAADAEFNTWRQNFVTYPSAHVVDLGLFEGPRRETARLY